MRTLSLGEAAAILAPEGCWIFANMRIRNYGGAWYNLGALAVGAETLEFFNTATLSDDVDRNTLSMTATFAREIGDASLSPLMTASPINDYGGTYQPALDVHREWDLWVAIVAIGTVPVNADYREHARGWIDRIDIAGEPAIITVQGRGPEAELIDDRIIVGDDPDAPISAENPVSYAGGLLGDTIQEILDKKYGSGTYVLTVDASVDPTAAVNPWDQIEEVGTFDLITQVASLRGSNVRYRYDASDVLTLTLFTPARVPGTPDWMIDQDAGGYETIDAGFSVLDVRNYIVVKYVDEDFGPQIVTSPVSPFSPSISRYGKRTLSIDLSATTQVTTDEAAGALADAIRADLEFPILEQAINATGYWFAELGDYVEFSANGIIYDEDQFGAVVQLEQTYSNGMLKTAARFKATPAGRYRGWLDFGPGAPRVPFTPTITANSATWKEFLVSSSYVPGVNAVATVNEFAQSVQFELAETLDFAVIISTNSVDVVDGTAEYGWVGSGFVTPGKIYYVRATAFSGPLSGGTPTGVEGTFIVANTSNLVQPEDTATVEWDLDEQGKWKANVIGLEEIGDAVDEIIDGGASDIGIPVVFVHTHGGKERLTTIPTAAAEVTGFRRKRYMVGAGSVRLRAIVENVTGTPSLGVESSADDFATAGDPVTTLPISGAGTFDTGWVPAPDEMLIDGFFRPTALNGANTAAMDLRYFAMEVRPALVTALRDFSDDFSDDFS